MLLNNHVIPSLSSLYTMPELVDVAGVNPSSFAESAQSLRVLLKNRNGNLRDP